MIEPGGKTNEGVEDMAVVSGSRRAGKESGVLSEAWWLARQDAKWSWLSYPATAAFVLLIGVFIIPAVRDMMSMTAGEVSRPETIFDYSFPDFLFIVFGTTLATNWMSGLYLSAHKDVFSKRLAFFKGLPVSNASIVYGRAFALGLALPLNALVFFTPLYLYTGLGDLGWSYAWFVLFWVGYSLLGMGGSLLAEMSLTGKVYTLLSFVVVFGILLVLVLLEWSLDLRLLERIIALSGSHGPLLALAALVVGVGGLGLLARTAIRRVEGRELG